MHTLQCLYLHACIVLVCVYVCGCERGVGGGGVKMEPLSLSSECRVTVAAKSRPCPFCHFHSQCYIEKCHYSFVTMCWRPGEKWIISRPAIQCGVYSLICSQGRQSVSSATVTHS